jgi:mRNA interferase MazF
MKQGEIWLINLNPTIGSEIKKTRPCVILNNDAIGVLPLKVIAPITDYKGKYEEVLWFVRLQPNRNNGLNKLSVIDLFQVRSVSEERFIKRIGQISSEELEEVKYALKLVFDIA